MERAKVFDLFGGKYFFLSILHTLMKPVTHYGIARIGSLAGGFTTKVAIRTKRTK